MCLNMLRTYVQGPPGIALNSEMLQNLWRFWVTIKLPVQEHTASDALRGELVQVIFWFFCMKNVSLMGWNCDKMTFFVTILSNVLCFVPFDVNFYCYLFSFSLQVSSSWNLLSFISHEYNFTDSIHKPEIIDQHPALRIGATLVGCTIGITP